ncbi:LON domain serine protease [Ceratobasidium sp. AG-Ba]|nr:LON domain serine protease [Ceratobasidium sp. AG-Ba]
MSPSSSEPPQLAPSQFAYFKTIPPTTTASTHRHQASRRLLLLNDLSAHENLRLERWKAKQVKSYYPHRNPKAKSALKPRPANKMARGLESAAIVESQVGGEAMANSTGAGINLPETQRETQLGPESQGEEERSEYEYKTLPVDPLILEELKLLGESNKHLSESEIKNLLNKMLETQALAMGTQIQPVTTVTQPSSGVGLASGDLNGSPLHEDSGKRSLSQRPKAIPSNKGSLGTQKRRLKASTINTASKRTRIAQDKDDSATESESDSDAPRSSSDSDSEHEDAPLPASQRLTSTATRPQPALTGRGFTQPARPSNPTPTKSPANTSPATTSAATTSATSYLARYPPPADLNNNDALVNWALKIAEGRARELNPSSGSSPGSSRPEQPDHPAATTTTTHVAQAIADHRAQRATTEHPVSQQNVGSSSQVAASGASTPIITPPTETGTTSVTPPTETSTVSKKKKPRKKTKLSDFPGRVGEIASAAIPYFLATVFAEGGYENLDVFQDWALDAYRRSSELEYPDEYEPPPVAVLKIMTRRASWLRGEIKKQLWSGVEYGYGFRNPAVSRTDIKHNRRLAKKLKPQVFHCKDLVFDTDQFEHPQFIRAIGAGLFWDSESLGVAFQDRFSPVPIPAVALILTMMQACIEEWKEGRHKAIELDVDTQKTVYESHLLSLYSYETTAANRLTRYRTQWATSGLDYSGATFDEDPTGAKSYVLASNVRPDTPPLEPNNNE